jgi:predicted DNA-binding protein (MmcQ/YjbR family)
MELDDYNAFCAALRATTHVVQWGGAHVWKVGGKMFAVAGWSNTDTLGITFKVTDIGFEMLKDQPGLRPAPYLASRGMLWIQHYDQPGLSEHDLQDYIAESHRLVSQGLTKKLQRELGLIA